MSLENPQYLNELNEVWPTGALDQQHEGDDHFRAIKRALKQTFPGMAGRAWRVISRSASGALTTTDNMTIQNAGGITLTPDAASVLGNGWMCVVRASGGAVVIDPAGNINGAGSMTVPAGYSAFVFSNGSEFFAMLVYQDVPPSVKPFPTGTKMVFNQTTAPTGWTKLASAIYNDATLRFTTGTVASGGADAFTTTFGTGKSTAGHALTEAQIPPHTHSYLRNPGTGCCLESGPHPVHPNEQGGTTGATGGGQAHSHTLTGMNVKYVDCIVASID